MFWRRSFCVALVLFAVSAGALPAVHGQTTRSSRSTRSTGSPKLAPGVMITIPALHKEKLTSLITQEKETFTGPFPIEEIPGDDWTPHFSAKSDTLFEKSKSVILRRRILWSLEFEFKPVRMITVDVPQPSGRMRRKLLWYLLYKVRNVGYHLAPQPKEDSFGHFTYSIKHVNRNLRFFPLFVLESHDLKRKEAYLDRVIPSAIGEIRRREKITGPLYNSVTITGVDLPWSTPTADKSVWGVAMWEDVDPRIDYFSVYVRGLTNAYRYKGSDEKETHGAPASRFKYKSLQLNFWRPGDSDNEHDREIRYGVPKYNNQSFQQRVLRYYGLTEPVDHQWVYR